PDLPHITPRTTDADYPRLHPDWQPPSNLAGTEDRKQKAAPIGDADKAASPLAETLALLKGCGRQVEIVRYLWDRQEKEARISAVARDLYGIRYAQLNHGLRTVRKQLERTRDNLDEKACPLCLTISANSVQIHLARVTTNK